MNYISYLLFRGFLAFISILPFSVLYFISDIMYGLIYYIFRYRKEVTRENLINSFPEKSIDEIYIIEKKYYHYMSDLIIEGLKGLSMNDEEILARHKIMNPEVPNAFFEKGKSLICVSGHYGNWEWLVFSGNIQINHLVVGIYKAINNPYIENYMHRRRSRNNCYLAPITETYNTFKTLENQPSLFLMFADQSPTNLRDCYWINFLNQDTPTLHGPEKYAKKYDYPVVYLDMQVVKRGYYELTFTTLVEEPLATADGEITKKFMKKLEEVICKEPAYWLWSHRRWKHKRIIP
jgi:Kdo2-lipid IVA lauroyltransferase/acyltransferase